MGISQPTSLDQQRRTEALAALSQRVAQVEGRMVGFGGAGAGAGSARVPTDWPAVDCALRGGLPRCGVHEWWHDDDRARARCAPLDALIHLAWQALLHDECHRPGQARRIAWIGRAVWPRAHAMVRGLRVGARGMFGAPHPRLWPDARLVDRSLLVDTAQNDSTRLWAAEHAARCPGVCAVIADGAGFDLPATRRLQLAATDVLLLLVRPSEHRAVLSACSTRWRVRTVDSARAAPTVNSASAWHARIPSEPAWSVELERAKGAVSPGIGVRAVITRAWEVEGTDAPPARVVAEAARRRSKKVARIAAQATDAAARRRKDQESQHEPAQNYPLLSGDRTAGDGAVVRRARRARRAR